MLLPRYASRGEVLRLLLYNADCGTCAVLPYIIVDDSVKDIPAETIKAYRAIRRTKQRPVDILVGTRSRFEARKNIPSVENEVFQKGVLLYGL